MRKSKFKPVIPSLRERKRYLVFEAISKGKVECKNLFKAIHDSVLGFLGQLGAAKAGIIILEDKWSQEKQKGIVRVSHKNLDHLKSSLMLVNKIDNNEVIIRSLGVSGILRKAVDKFMDN